jgi:hypothetical protein
MVELLAGPRSERRRVPRHVAAQTFAATGCRADVAQLAAAFHRCVGEGPDEVLAEDGSRATVVA